MFKKKRKKKPPGKHKNRDRFLFFLRRGILFTLLVLTLFLLTNTRPLGSDSSLFFSRISDSLTIRDNAAQLTTYLEIIYRPFYLMLTPFCSDPLYVFQVISTLSLSLSAVFFYHFCLLLCGDRKTSLLLAAVFILNPVNMELLSRCDKSLLIQPILLLFLAVAGLYLTRPTIIFSWGLGIIAGCLFLLSWNLIILLPLALLLPFLAKKTWGKEKRLGPFLGVLFLFLATSLILLSLRKLTGGHELNSISVFSYFRPCSTGNPEDASFWLLLSKTYIMAGLALPSIFFSLPSTLLHYANNPTGLTLLSASLMLVLLIIVLFILDHVSNRLERFPIFLTMGLIICLPALGPLTCLPIAPRTDHLLMLFLLLLAITLKPITSLPNAGRLFILGSLGLITVINLYLPLQLAERTQADGMRMARSLAGKQTLYLPAADHLPQEAEYFFALKTVFSDQLLLLPENKNTNDYAIRPRLRYYKTKSARDLIIRRLAERKTIIFEDKAMIPKQILEGIEPIAAGVLGELFLYRTRDSEFGTRD